MSIPAEIRAVERPKNTVVVAYGRNKDKYAVRSRSGCRNVGGRRIPIEGPVIGHIVDGEYVPLEDRPEPSEHDIVLKDWANVEAAFLCSSDVLLDLKTVYGQREAMQMYCIAVLKACYHGIEDDELRNAYEGSFLSVRLPGVPLTRNNVSKLCDYLEESGPKAVQFMRDRVARLRDPHDLAICEAASDSSGADPLPDYPGRPGSKGAANAITVFSYDPRTLEPVCFKNYPGKTLDTAILGDFIETYAIKGGIVMADSRSSANAARKASRNEPGLSYLLPLRRNAAPVDRCSMPCFGSVLKDDPSVECGKAKVSGRRRWLYWFRYTGTEAGEGRACHLGPKSAGPGAVVFESDRDASCEGIHRSCSGRRLVESVLGHCCSGTRTRHGSAASELLCFLSAIVTSRLVRAFSESGLLGDYSYGKVMRCLGRARKVRMGKEWKLVGTTARDLKVLQALGLVPRVITIRNPRGRPKKK